MTVQLPTLILGGAVFGYDYLDDKAIRSDAPRQTILEAFKNGITAIDTSPYYTTSQEVIGQALKQIKPEWPRDKYKLITKAGRYGKTKQEGFDYSPERIKRSVIDSLEKLDTDYLDAVYLHDPEFVCEQPGDAGAQGSVEADENGQISQSSLAKWQLADGDEGKVTGPGDQKVLDALAVLIDYKKKGTIKAVGFAGYPLPTLLRLARLAKHHLEPVDIIQSYCHWTLQNLSLNAYIPLFEKAGVKTVVNAGPLSMGLLREAGPHSWHPAWKHEPTKKATLEAVDAVRAQGEKLENVAIAFGLSPAGTCNGVDTPSVVGFATPEEVRVTVDLFKSLYGNQPRKFRMPGTGLDDSMKKQLELEKLVVDIYRRSGTLGWTWEVGRN